MGKFACHEVHVGGCVVVEHPIAFAQIIEAGVAVAVGGEAVAWTFAVACEEHVALAALAGQGLMLQLAETLLLGAVEHLDEGVLADVAQPMVGAHEVVARVDVAVGLHHGGMTALFGVGADAGCDAHPVGECAVEEFDIGLAHIALHPFVEDGTKETAPFASLNASGFRGKG